MIEITENNLINILKEKFPDFIPYWEFYVNKWGEDLGLSNHVLTFADYVLDAIKSEKYDAIEQIFNYIEFLMCNGDMAVQNAIATCLLEALLNEDTDEIQFIKFSKYLGKETLAYCKAWNEFCGVHTEVY